MRLADLLVDEWIALPVEADDLGDVVERLVERIEVGGKGSLEGLNRLRRKLLEGGADDLVRVNDDVVVAVARLEGLEDVAVSLAVSSEPFRLVASEGSDDADGRSGRGGEDGGSAGEGRGDTGPDGDGDVGQRESGEPPATARALLLLLTPRNPTALTDRFVPSLVRVLREGEHTRRLLEAGSPIEIRGLHELMATELEERLLVEDALTPLKYRIYPDTPLSEVVDLMVRRQLHAVPVVGENLEVLGIITVGDALRHLLPRRRSRGREDDRPPPPQPPARDVMTRAVMCVSEDQSLHDAAHLMVNREVEQLPVVRDGELIGFLTREAILERLFG